MPVREREESAGDEECPVCMRPFHEFDVDSGEYVVKNDIGPQLHMYQCNHAVCQDCWNRSATSDMQALRVCPECRAQSKPGMGSQDNIEQIAVQAQSPVESDDDETVSSSASSVSVLDRTNTTVPMYEEVEYNSIRLLRAVCFLMLGCVKYVYGEIMEDIHEMDAGNSRTTCARAADWVFKLNGYQRPYSPHSIRQDNFIRYGENILLVETPDARAFPRFRDALESALESWKSVRNWMRDRDGKPISWNMIFQLIVTSDMFSGMFVQPIEADASIKRQIFEYQQKLKRVLLAGGVFKWGFMGDFTETLRGNLSTLQTRKVGSYIDFIGSMLGVLRRYENRPEVSMVADLSWWKGIIDVTMRQQDIPTIYDEDNTNALSLICALRDVGYIGE